MGSSAGVGGLAGASTSAGVGGLAGMSTSAGICGLLAGRLAGSMLLALCAFLLSFYRAAQGLHFLYAGRVRKESGDGTGGRNIPESFEATIYTEEDAIACSEAMAAFCRDNGLPARTANIAALCVEELACNALSWGYGSGGGKCSTGQNAGVDLRAVCSNGELRLRFRDNGRHFDPAQYVRQFRAAPQDPTKNVGLRIVSGMAAEMRYISLLDCNIVMLRL